jgi:hypothetical protein
MECTANFCSQRSRFFVCSFRSHAPNRVTTQSPNAAVINANITAVIKYDTHGRNTSNTSTNTLINTSAPTEADSSNDSDDKERSPIMPEQHHRCRHDPALAMKTSATKTPATKTGKTASHLRKHVRGSRSL